MIPEAGLMATLVIVFLADLILKGEKKHTILSVLTGVWLRLLCASCQSLLRHLLAFMCQQPQLKS